LRLKIDPTLLALRAARIAIVPSVLPTHRYDLQIVRLAYSGAAVKLCNCVDKRRSLPRSADDFCQSLLTYVREVFPISRPSNKNRSDSAADFAARRAPKVRDNQASSISAQFSPLE
jgi:hypothetical protein